MNGEKLYYFTKVQPHQVENAVIAEVSATAHKTAATTEHIQDSLQTILAEEVVPIWEQEVPAGVPEGSRMPVIVQHSCPA